MVAGWNFLRQTRGLACAPATDEERLDYAGTTLVFVLTVAGGPVRFNVPGGGQPLAVAGGGVLTQAGEGVVVSINTQRLAGAVAGQPGVVVLLAQENGGGGGGEDDDNLELALRLKDQKAAIKQLVPQSKDWEDLGLDAYDSDFYKHIYEKMVKAKHIHFDLTGVRDINTPDGILRGYPGWNPRGSTNWELRTIWDTPSLKSKTTFYRDTHEITHDEVLRLR